jgi:predicted DNA-binding mobile mystery protein A
MEKKHLQIEQLDNRLVKIRDFYNIINPEKGWINNIRTAIGMSLAQLGKKLNITPQTLKALELREQSGSITIRKLDEVARRLNMKLIYAVVPIEGTISEMVEKQAKIKASEIVQRTSHNMKLEDQQNDNLRLQNEVELITKQIVLEMPRYLWD